MVNIMKTLEIFGHHRIGHCKLTCWYLLTIIPLSLWRMSSSVSILLLETDTEVSDLSRLFLSCWIVEASIRGRLCDEMSCSRAGRRHSPLLRSLAKVSFTLSFSFGDLWWGISSGVPWRLQRNPFLSLNPLVLCLLRQSWQWERSKF